MKPSSRAGKPTLLAAALSGVNVLPGVGWFLSVSRFTARGQLDCAKIK